MENTNQTIVNETKFEYYRYTHLILSRNLKVTTEVRNHYFELEAAFKESIPSLLSSEEKKFFLGIEAFMWHNRLLHEAHNLCMHDYLLHGLHNIITDHSPNYVEDLLKWMVGKDA